jgi:hypothetical protein
MRVTRGLWPHLDKQASAVEESASHPRNVHADTLALTQPLLHAIIFLIQITMVSLLVRKFNAYYAARPLLTTMITNAVRIHHLKHSKRSTTNR